MTDDHKAAAHPAVAPKPAAKPAAKPPMAKKAKTAKANLPAIPSVNLNLTPQTQGRGITAAAVAVTLGAGALIGHAISRMFLRR